MSLNVENLLICSSDQIRIRGLVQDYLGRPFIASRTDWGLPLSKLLAPDDPRRKIAISTPTEGWTALVEAKEVVDLSLATLLSEELQTIAIVIQLSEGTGAVGYGSCLGGKLVNTYFNDDDENPRETIRRFLKTNNTNFSPVSFRYAIDRVADGWVLATRRKQI